MTNAKAFHLITSWRGAADEAEREGRRWGPMSAQRIEGEARARALRQCATDVEKAQGEP